MSLWLKYKAVGVFCMLFLGNINYRNQTKLEDCTYTFTFSSGCRTYAGRGGYSSDSIKIPTNHAKTLRINSASNCTLAGDISGVLENNADVSSDTMITITHSSSAYTDEDAPSTNITWGGSISFTLLY